MINIVQVSVWDDVKMTSRNVLIKEDEKEETYFNCSVMIENNGVLIYNRNAHESVVAFINVPVKIEYVDINK